MKDDRGLSLIELVVVIAIMAVVATGMVVGVYSSATWKSKKAVEQIDQALSETRVQALSKTNAWMEIKYQGEHYVLMTSYAADVILDGKFTLTYHTREDKTEADAKDIPLILTYDRSSGAFSGVKASVSTSADETTYQSRYAADGITVLYCDRITITQGSREWNITLSPETGKHTVVR